MTFIAILLEVWGCVSYSYQPDRAMNSRGLQIPASCFPSSKALLGNYRLGKREKAKAYFNVG
jgi:hypothetical protein